MRASALTRLCACLAVEARAELRAMKSCSFSRCACWLARAAASWAWRSARWRSNAS
jgi:hypothetical protein